MGGSPTLKKRGTCPASAELQLELTRLVIDGKDYPIVSSDYSLRGKGRGSDTAKEKLAVARSPVPSSARLPAAAKGRPSARAWARRPARAFQVFTRGSAGKGAE